MRLKKIELHGFKSFCDKATLHFDHQIVGVVGPNGCGKSNVLDAIRWVMGEQSMKSLRGKSRSDVIFAGSEKRKPSQMASVTLTLSDVPPEHRPEGFEEHSEISITRRLTSKGESGYLINGQPGRLRDIRMLFLGTGLGNKQSYALLEQGRVNEFIQSTPEKRRLWVEEAAGISRYKEQRKLAESRMQSTQTNLDRLQDLMTELSSQRSSLQRQANKAKKHRLLKEEIRQIDLHIASYRYLENWANNRHITLLLADLDETEKKARYQLKIAEEQYTQLQYELRDESEQLQEERQKIQEIHAQIALLNQTIEHLTEDIEALKTRQIRSENAHERLHEQLDHERQEILRLTERRTELQEEQKKATLELEEKEILAEELEDRLAESLENIEEIKSELFETATREATLRNQIQEIQRRLEELSNRQDRNTEENDFAQTQFEELEEKQQLTLTELHRCQTSLESLSAQQEEKETRQEQLAGQLHHAEYERKLLEARLSEKQARLSSLKDLQEQFQDLDESTRVVLEARAQGRWTHDQIRGVVAEWIEPSERYETAVAAALGDQLQYIIASHPNVALDVAQFIQNGHWGRLGITILPQQPPSSLPTIPEAPFILGRLASFVPTKQEYQTLLSHLLKPYILVENIEQTLTHFFDKMPQDITFVSLKGELLHPDGSLIVGTQQDISLGLLQRRREIKELSSQVTELSEELDDWNDQIDSLEEQKEELEEQLEEIKNKRQQLAFKQIELDKDRQRFEADLANLQERLHFLQHENQRIAIQQAELESEHSTLETQLHSLTQNREQQEQYLAALQQQTQNDQQRLQETQQILTTLKVQNAARKERDDALAQQIAQLEENQRTLGQRQFNIRREKEQIAQQLTEKTHALLLHKKELKALQQQVEHDEAQFQSQHQQLAQIETKLQKTLQSVEKYRSTLEQLNEKRTQYLLRQKELEVELKALQEDIQKRYHLPIGETLPQNHCRKPPQKNDFERLETLKKQLSRIGEVNPLAEKEFAEIDERHRFLSSQIDDLNKALHSLKKTIQKINQQTKEQFKETFEKIRDYFGELFPKLFEGGKGELILTDPHNLLETGVDIMVHPPGKRRQTVALLSGGEKAMTTLALLFSFFLYKPAPFCVMDEVDAPLDEANVDRFNKLLRELSSLTQFIVITHNKRTMEMGDHLYGVTMQEPGVSTIVAVQLQDELVAA